MLTESDFITLPYTPDMTLAGIQYARQSLPHTYDRMGGNRFKRLRRIVAGKAVELAFKRHLNQQEIPHDMLGSTPFTDPDHYDLSIGGRRCDIKSFMLTQKERISQVRKTPHLLLEAQAPDLDYGIALVPYNDGNPDATNRNIVEGGWGYAIPRGSKNMDAAWEFLKYVTADEGNLEFFKGQTRPSPVIEFNNDPFFAEANPYWPVIQEAMEKSGYSPASPVQAKLNEITVQMLEEALLHKKTPEEALQWAEEEAQKAIDEWWAQQ